MVVGGMPGRLELGRELLAEAEELPVVVDEAAGVALHQIGRHGGLLPLQ